MVSIPKQRIPVGWKFSGLAIFLTLAVAAAICGYAVWQLGVLSSSLTTTAAEIFGHSKKTQIINHFATVDKSAQSLTQLKQIQDASVALESIAFGAMIEMETDSDPRNRFYKKVAKKYEGFIQETAAQYSFKDFALVLNNGYVILQAQGSEILGKQLKSGQLANSALSNCVQQANEKGSSFTGVFLDSYFTAPSAFICRPVRSKFDRDGYSIDDIMATLVVSIDWNGFGELVTDSSGLPNSYDSYLTGPAGYMVSAAQNPQRPLMESLALELKEASGQAEKAVQDKPPHPTEQGASVTRNETQLYHYEFPFEVLGQNWTLNIETQKAGVNAPLEKITYTMIGLIAAFMALVTLLTLIAAKLLTRPIADSSSELSHVSGRLGDIIGDLTHNTSSLKDQITEQSASIEESSAALEEIKSMVERGQAITDETSEIASQTAVNATNNAHKFGQLSETMTAIDQSSQEISQLTQSIEEIAERIQIMNDIVFQTKLLSFNASIEAERAAEHGRGFAVVAQEVGSLAQKTGQAAAQIEGIVKEGLQKTRDIVERNSQTVRSGLEVLESTKEAVASTTGMMEKLNDLTTEVKDANAEQLKGVSQVVNAVINLEAVTRQNSNLADANDAVCRKIQEDAMVLKENTATLSLIATGHDQSAQDQYEEAEGDGSDAETAA